VSAFIDEHGARFGVERICQTLGVSASAYYERASGRRSARAVEDERLLGVITDLHERNYFAYGSRRMWKAAADQARAADGACRPRDRDALKAGRVPARRPRRPEDTQPAPASRAWSCRGFGRCMTLAGFRKCI
jgi:putative transposase